MNTRITQSYIDSHEFIFESKLVNPQVEDRALIRKYHGQIIIAATELFGKGGYHSTTIRQIAKQSGIGIGSIYQYVKNKEEILVLILEYILNQYEYRLSQAINSTESPLNKLQIGIETYYRIIDQEYIKLILAYSSTSSLSRPYRDYIKDLELRTNQIFESILQEGVEQDQFKPINIPLVAYEIIMLGHMWALKRWFFKSFITIDRYINQQIRFIGKMVTKGEMYD